MIIVSQDKDVIVNFNNVENIWINNPLENNEGKFEIRAESYSNNIFIGEYTTEERAKEVLEEIVKLYEQKDLLNGDISYKNVNYPKVYRMPEVK